MFALMAAAAWTGTAHAGGGQSSRAATATDVLAIAENALRAGDQAAAEAAFTALLQDPAAEMRAEARFRLAKMWANAGRTTEAAVLLRRVLDDHPSAAPVRLEYAALLHKMGNDDAAFRQLRSLRTTDLPPNVARFVDRWSASMQARKPFGVQVELALAPDTNINRASRSDTLGTIYGDFTFDEDGQQKSGIGVAARGSIHRRMEVSRDINLLARAGADLNLYRDKQFNDIAAELSVGPEVKLLGTRFTAEAGIGMRWYGMQLFQRDLRLAGSATRAVDSVSQLRLDAAVRSTSNLVNDLQDGFGVTLRARYERAISPQLSLAASFSTDRFRARDDAYSTRSWLAGVSAFRDLGRMTFSLGAEIGRLTADDRLSILPEARQDKLTRISFGAVMRQLTVAGFAPVARVIHERNKSTVEFHDFRRTRTEFGITRAF